jgi:hypothetical protein
VETSAVVGPGGNSTYFLNAKIDGTLHTFDVNDAAKITDFGSGMSSLSILGSASSSASDLEGINLSINFFNVSPAVGTYSEVNSGNDYIAAGVYNPNSATLVYTAGIAASSNVPLSIAITKLDSTEIEGTFQGAFYKTDITTGSPSADYVTITEGTFRLPIQ